MTILSTSQIETFQRNGYLLLEDVIADDTLRKLSSEFKQWKEESRAHTKPYGSTYDNRARFDLEPGHSAEKPALRRIASPIEISDTYLALGNTLAGAG